jgi:hypothetical protein
MSLRHRRVKREAALLGLLVGLTVGCRTEVRRDVRDVPLSGACAAATVDEIDAAIWRAGRKVGWQIDRVEPGVLWGTWRWKHHAAVVSIVHRGGRLGIRYEWSQNLLAEDDRIHRSYNRMVERLVARIQAEPIAPERGGACGGPPPRPDGAARGASARRPPAARSGGPARRASRVRARARGRRRTRRRAA